MRPPRFSLDPGNPSTPATPVTATIAVVQGPVAGSSHRPDAQRLPLANSARRLRKAFDRGPEQSDVLCSPCNKTLSRTSGDPMEIDNGVDFSNSELPPERTDRLHLDWWESSKSTRRRLVTMKLRPL